MNFRTAAGICGWGRLFGEGPDDPAIARDLAASADRIRITDMRARRMVAPARSVVVARQAG
ncbi:MAG: hypothetical protein HY735_15445 [Verrucomicrobia bacterium]|nr:hypothetical protein [Verrucomicrobiota bacterium]